MALIACLKEVECAKFPDCHCVLNALQCLPGERTRMWQYEPRCEKTGLRGVRPGPTQTGLYSHRRWLEA